MQPTILFPFHSITPLHMSAAKTSVDLFRRPVSLFRQVKAVLEGTRGGAGSRLVRLDPGLLEGLRRMQRVVQVRGVCVVLWFYC